MVTHLFLKHSIDCADVEMHMLVQTGSEAMNESHGADAQGSFIHLFRTRAVFMQAQLHDLQENAQRPGIPAAPDVRDAAFDRAVDIAAARSAQKARNGVELM